MSRKVWCSKNLLTFDVWKSLKYDVWKLKFWWSDANILYNWTSGILLYPSFSPNLQIILPTASLMVRTPCHSVQYWIPFFTPLDEFWMPLVTRYITPPKYHIINCKCHLFVGCSRLNEAFFIERTVDRSLLNPSVVWMLGSWQGRLESQGELVSWWSVVESTLVA